MLPKLCRYSLLKLWLSKQLWGRIYFAYLDNFLICLLFLELDLCDIFDWPLQFLCWLANLSYNGALCSVLLSSEGIPGVKNRDKTLGSPKSFWLAVYAVVTRFLKLHSLLFEYLLRGKLAHFLLTGLQLIVKFQPCCVLSVLKQMCLFFISALQSRWSRVPYSFLGEAVFRDEERI